MTARSKTGVAMIRLIGFALAGVAALSGNPLPCAAAEKPAAEKDLLALTDGQRLKVVWNQDAKVKYFDSQAGEIVDLAIPAGSAPLLTPDGNSVFVSTGKAPADRVVVMCDLQSQKVTELAKGPGNNLLAVWQDPKTKRLWVYVNDAGDKGENWNVPAGKIERFPVDEPAERELFWDRTSSHIYLMFSADGTRACFEPSWSNIGMLSIAYTPEGKVDQDASTFKTFGGGCFPSLAPDNSYRLFRLEGDHHSITVHEGDGSSPRKVPVSEMPGVKDKGRNTWLTRWSTHPRFMTLVAPAGNDARVWLLRLDEACTKVEGAVAVSNEGGPQCWQSQAWIEPSAAQVAR